MDMKNDNRGTPGHIGIIMDGNGRWAEYRGLNRSAGHKEGLVAAKNIVKQARDSGVKYLSLYTFSTENWRRTEDEVNFLMGLIKTSLKKEYRFYRENEIRVLHSGDLSRLPEDIRREIYDVEHDTRNFGKLTVNLAINYGGRDEIIRAVQSAQSDGINLIDLNERRITRYLDQPELPDLDLVIRTGGEQRLSNFMIWRASYAELYFSPTFWPDFQAAEFRGILEWYRGRQRRFGGTG